MQQQALGSRWSLLAAAVPSALLALSAGCGSGGDDDDSAGDAAPADADLDNGAQVSIAAFAPNGVAPLTDGVVVFSAPDGTVLDQRALAADGTVIGSVPPGGAVTLVRPADDGGRVISTITGIADGDELRFGGHRRLPGASLGTMTVSYSALKGAASYEVWNECGSAASEGAALSVEIELFASCPPSPLDLVVSAFAADGALLGFALDAFAWEAGGAAAIPDEWRDPSEFEAVLHDVPLDFSDILFERFALSARGAPLTRTVTPERAKGTILGIEPAVAALGADMAIQIAFSNPAQPTPQLQWARTAEAATFDYDARIALLPWVSPVAIETTSGLIWWTLTPGTEGAVNDADAVIVQLHDDGCADSVGVHWTLVAPGAATDVQTPQLGLALVPRLLDCWRATATLSEERDGDGDDTVGYDALRADADLHLAELCANQGRPSATRVRRSGATPSCE